MWFFESKKSFCGTLNSFRCLKNHSAELKNHSAELKYGFLELKYHSAMSGMGLK
jgi:hypothetical protein